MGFGNKCLDFVLVNGKHGQGTHCTKMGANILAENTPNAPKFIWTQAQKFGRLAFKNNEDDVTNQKNLTLIVEQSNKTNYA